jgi:hypothetical protein
LEEIESWGSGGYPIPAELIEDTDAKWFIYPELFHVSQMYLGSVHPEYSQPVKDKYAASWGMYSKHYPRLTAQLIASKQDLTSICPTADWAPVIERHPEDCSYAIKTRVEF